MAETIEGYEQDILKRLQLFLTDMMGDIDEICLKYNIRYFVIYGTAIGAIRHKGFIPWDDDIDIGMLLEDYKRLLQIPKDEWEKRGMELITPLDFYPSHLMMINRIYKKGTIFEKKTRLKYDKRNGYTQYPLRPIGIDIFVYNHIDSPDVAKQWAKRMSLYQRLYWRSNTGMKRVSSDPFKYQIRCIRNDFLNKLLNLGKNPQIKTYKLYSRQLERMDSAGGKYVTSFESEIIEEMIKSVSLEKDMFPLIRVPFENIEVNIQKNYEEMLTSMYGDYLELPPVEKRINHKPGILDFGDGKGNVIKGTKNDK